MWDIGLVGWIPHVQDLLGFEIPAERFKRRMIRVDFIVQHLRNQSIDDDSTPDQIMQWDREMILLIMHGFIFANANQNYLSLYMFHALIDFEQIPRYSGRSAALTYLYR